MTVQATVPAFTEASELENHQLAGSVVGANLDPTVLAALMLFDRAGITYEIVKNEPPVDLSDKPEDSIVNLNEVEIDLTQQTDEQRAQQAEQEKAREAELAELVRVNSGLAINIAKRYMGRGEPFDDLVQVAMMGLIKAHDRFDPDRGFAFSSFAVPTITGELKRHFRDKTWAVRVPRHVQELRSAVGTATETLSQQLSRQPTTKEIADHLGVTIEEVTQGVQAINAYKASSLHATDDSLNSKLIGRSVANDESLAQSVSLRQAIAQLPERDQTIVRLSFWENKTQEEIAQKIGCSQMHVSRILRKAFAKLKDVLGPDFYLV